MHAVVLHWQFWPGISRTLDALLREIAPENVIIVDNGSQDGSLEQIRAHYPTCEVLALTENRGYAAGMNAGIRATTDDVLFLTHECVIAPGVIDQLTQELTDPLVGIVGPALAYASQADTLFSLGGAFDPATRMDSYHRLEGRLVVDHQRDPSLDVDWVDGACLLVRREVLEQLGGFNEGYFLYFEETELCCRARRCGWRVRCVPKALAFQSPQNKPLALWTRNRLRFLRRNAGTYLWARQLYVDMRGFRDPQIRRGLLAYFCRTDPKRLRVSPDQPSTYASHRGGWRSVEDRPVGG